jgi:hypothetical protein
VSTFSENGSAESYRQSILRKPLKLKDFRLTESTELLYNSNQRHQSEFLTAQNDQQSSFRKSVVLIPTKSGVTSKTDFQV